MKTRFARREFIKRASQSLGFLGVGSVVFESAVAHFFQKAFAQSMGAKLNPSGYYVHFTMPGGPPRWYFDLPLTPTGKSAANFVQGGFGTTIEKVGAAYQSIYNVEKHVIGGKTIYLPPVWNFDVAGQDFSSLLPHTTFIRGVDMEINSHPLSSARQVAPVIGSYSTSGVVADDAQRPIPAIVDGGVNPAQAFKSKKGLTVSPISYTENASTNPVATLLTPFKNYRAGRVVHGEAANQLEEQAFREFEKFAEARGITSSAVTTMYDNAMELIEENIFSLSNEWAPTVAKYRNIVSTALHPAKGSLPGIYDTKVAGADDGRHIYERNAGQYVKLADIRDMVTAQTNIPLMAENFAIAEILLDRVTSNMTLGMRAITGVQTGSGVVNLTHDQHFLGCVVSTMMTTLFYRAFLGCLTSYVSTLKTRGIFDRTVLHISAEFNRTPKASGAGADHGFMGSNVTLISGMVKDVGVVGNIQKASYSTTYEGTFGVAKNYVLDGFNRPIQTNDIARTITAMLGVDDIVTNGRALLAPQGGKWVLRKPEAKNV